MRATAFWLVAAPLVAAAFGAAPRSVWVGIAVATGFGTSLPFGMFLAGLRPISAAHAGVTPIVEPVVAAAAAFGVPGERLG